MSSSNFKSKDLGEKGTCSKLHNLNFDFFVKVLYNIIAKYNIGKVVIIMSVIESIGIGKFLLYLLAINVIAFLAMGIDKWKAKRGAWRIPEQTLLSLVLLGGGIGGIAGMYTFRHKTKKPRFFIGFPVILIMEIVALVYIIVKY